VTPVPPATPNEVVVTLDGRARPATVVERGAERTLVRFRDAGGFREEWVRNADVVAVEAGPDRTKLLKLLVLAAVGVLGLALLLYPSGSDKRLSETLPSGPPSPTPSASASPATAPSPAVTTTRAVLFGDSFVAGRGLPAGTPTAVHVAAQLLGWEATVLGGDGTAFTTGGKRGGQPYALRLAALTTAPDVLLLQGGASDTGASPSQLTAAVTKVLDDLARRFPDTKVIMLGPVAMEQPPDRQLVRVDKALREAAASKKITYVGPIALGWITAQNAEAYTAGAGFYPNAAGHAYLGRKLAQVLRNA
jgi:lysophospholipase L1-like esterase